MESMFGSKKKSKKEIDSSIVLMIQEQLFISELETSRRGILSRHQPCDSERIEILSDSIECNHPSRNTSSLLYPESR